MYPYNWIAKHCSLVRYASYNLYAEHVPIAVLSVPPTIYRIHNRTNRERSQIAAKIHDTSS